MTFSSFIEWWKSVWASYFGQTRLSRVGEGDNTLDTVRMADPNGPYGEQVIDLTRLEQFGDVVIPIPETNCAIWRLADGGVVMSLGVPNLRPKDCKAGDRALYCSQLGTVLKLHGNSSATPGVIELKQATGGRVAITQGGDIQLTDASGHKATLSSGVLTVEDTVTAQHFAGRGTPPTLTPGAGLGAGNASLFPNASDTAFNIQLNVSMGTPSVLATVTFNQDYGSVPQGISIFPVDSAAAVTGVGGSFYATVTKDKLEIFSTNTLGPGGGLPDGGYVLSVMVLR